MLLKVYTVFDMASNAYLQPMFFLTKGQAIRAFTEAISDEKHVFCKYPSDYVLFELGSFDDSSAKFELYSSPVSLGVAVEFVNRSVVDVNVRGPHSDDVN